MTSLLSPAVALSGLTAINRLTLLAMNLPHFALLDLSPGQIIALVAIIGGCCIGVLVPIFAMYFHHRRQQLLHETARFALEKGQPMPALPGLAEDARPAAVQQNEDCQNDLRGGLVLMGVGFGLYLFFLTLGASSLRFVGAIPGFIGVALLLTAWLNRRQKNPPPADRPPQS